MGKRKDGSLRPDSYCRQCRAIMAKEYKRKLRSTPGGLAKYRTLRRKASQRYREKNREASRKASRQWYQRLKQDPEALRAYLDRHRMNYRLRQERNGGRKITEIRQYRPPRQSDPLLPIEPFLAWIQSRAEFYGGMTHLAKAADCDLRTLTVCFEQRQRIELSKVDRILIREGSTLIHEIYPDI